MESICMSASDKLFTCTVKENFELPVQPLLHLNKVLVLIGLILFWGSSLSAQNSDEVSETAREVQSKATGIQLSSQTNSSEETVNQSGDFSYMVPLYNVTYGSLSLPLNLNYKAGIKVDQKASEVGLGWELNFGSIKRDYGAFEPDYNATAGEVGMRSHGSPTTNSSAGKLTTTHNSGGDQVIRNPFNNLVKLMYNNMYNNYNPGPEKDYIFPDNYHVSLPSSAVKTFSLDHDAGDYSTTAVGTNSAFKFNNTQQWKAVGHSRIFAIDQEFSRINEFNYNTANHSTAYYNSPHSNGRYYLHNYNSYAAAIAIPPYVPYKKFEWAATTSNNSTSVATIINNKVVEYSDYETFIVKDEKGKTYVFGRPLRYQKYLLSENPFWSVMDQADKDGTSNLANASRGDFWKIDFIGEWLLTEIHGINYVDENNNGKADEEDSGDWIRIDYTSSTSDEPEYREWLNYTQTDKASSIWKERAYVERIVTPEKEVLFTTSDKYDITHDFFGSIGNNFYDLEINEYYAFNHLIDQSKISGPTGATMKVRYPLTEQRYDQMIIRQNATPYYQGFESEILTIDFNYAAKGSAQELCVSNYLMRNNAGQDRNLFQYPATNSFDIQNFNSSEGRGKTTLLGVTFTNSANESKSYEFKYGFNPSFNEIHKSEIVRKAFFPTLRASCQKQRNYPEFVYTYENNSVETVRPHDFLATSPFERATYYWQYNQGVAANIEAHSFVTNFPNFTPNATEVKSVDYTKLILKDQFGYYYNTGSPDDDRKAWSMTKIITPEQGSISIEYEADETDLTASGISNTPSLESIDQYNSFAKKRSKHQTEFSKALIGGVNPYIHGWGALLPPKKRPRTFEVNIGSNAGGIRLKRIIKDDGLNPPIITDYEYGIGYLTALPTDFLSIYLSAYSDFIQEEYYKQNFPEDFNGNIFKEENKYEYRYGLSWISDYNNAMVHKLKKLRFDKSAGGEHYYNFIKTKNPDNSHVKNYYGNVSSSNFQPKIQKQMPVKFGGNSTLDVLILLGESNINKSIVKKKVEYYEAGQASAYKTREYTYQTNIIDAGWQLQTLDYKLFPSSSYPNYAVLSNSLRTYPAYDINGYSYGLSTGILWNANCPHLNALETCGSPPYNDIWNDKQNNYQADVYVAFRSNKQTSHLEYSYSPDNIRYNQRATIQKTQEIIEEHDVITTKDYAYESDYGLLSDVATTYSEYTKSGSLEEEIITESFGYATKVYENAHWGGSPNPINTLKDRNLIDYPMIYTKMYDRPIFGNSLIDYQFTPWKLDNNGGTTTYEVVSPNYKKYIYKDDLNSDGTFMTYPQVYLYPWNIGQNNTNNKLVTQSEALHVDENFRPVSQQIAGHFEFNVYDHSNGQIKANFKSSDPIRDAAYTGFEDLPTLEGSVAIGSVSKADYWYDQNNEGVGNSLATVYYVDNPQPNYCSNAQYVLFIEDATGFQVGDDVLVRHDPNNLMTINQLGGGYTPYPDYSGQITNMITISPNSVQDTIFTPSNQYNSIHFTTMICLNSPMPFAYFGPPYPVEMIIEETSNYGSLTKEAQRSGEFSYELQTRESSSVDIQKSPVRPVKIPVDPNSSCNQMGIGTRSGCLTTSIYPNCRDNNYSISFWMLNTNLANPTAATETKTSGTISNSPISGAIKLVIEQHYEAGGMVSQCEKYIDISSINNQWTRYQVDFDVVDFYDTETELRVYLANENINANPASRIFIDDLLIYPEGALYTYSSFDKFGNITHFTDENENTKSNEYDSWGRLVASKDAEGNLIQTKSYFTSNNFTNNHSYEESSNYIDNSHFSKTRNFIDGFGKVNQSITTEPSKNIMLVSDRDFDNRGRVSKEWLPYPKMGTVFAPRMWYDHQTELEDIYGSGVSPFYANGYKNRPEVYQVNQFQPKTASESQANWTLLDGANTTTISVGDRDYAAGELFKFTYYDEPGNFTRTYKDKKGRIVHKEWFVGNNHLVDANGTITLDGSSPQEVNTASYIYDVADNLIEVIDGDGKSTTYKYDSYGNVIEKNSPDDGVTTYKYDNYGKLIASTNETQALKLSTNDISETYYTYDGLERLIEKGEQVGFWWSLNTTPKANYFYNGSKQNNSLNKVTREEVHSTLPDLSQTFPVINHIDVYRYEYNENGMLTDQYFQLNGLTGEHHLSTSYNRAGLPTLTEYVHPTSSANNFVQKFEYDDLGRIRKTYSGRTEASATEDNYYRYDALGQLFRKSQGATGNSSNPYQVYNMYNYNLRGEMIKHYTEDFKLELDYDRRGMIESQKWTNTNYINANPNYEMHLYDYAYDGRERLRGADYSTISYLQNPYSNIEQNAKVEPVTINCVTNYITDTDGAMQMVDEFYSEVEDQEIEVSEQFGENLNVLIDITETQLRESQQSFEEMLPETQDNFLNDLYYLGEDSEINMEEVEWAYQQVYGSEEGGSSESEGAGSESGGGSEMNQTFLEALSLSIPLEPEETCSLNLNALAVNTLNPTPTAVSSSLSSKYDAAYWYSGNGNIETLYRSTHQGTRHSYNYNYQVGNNRLASVDRDISGTVTNLGFTYDEQGRMLSDDIYRITNINYSSYDAQPQTVTVSGLGSSQYNYRYNSSGKRVVKELSSTSAEYHLGPVILDQNGAPLRYLFNDGYATADVNGNLTKYYNTTDWLGTIRAVIRDDGFVSSTQDHYPFGGLMPDLNVFNSSEDARYQFTGHEFDGESQLGYHGARYYNRILGRYISVDPLAEERSWMSPYNYVQDNPITRIDPTGALDGWVKDANGSVSWDKNTNSQEEFNENYAGKAGYSYVSDPNDARDYYLPDGSGKLRMLEWSEYSNEGKLTNRVGPGISMEFIANNGVSSKWFQTFDSNYPNFNGTLHLKPQAGFEERIDNGFGDPDPTNAVYFRKSSVMGDMPSRWGDHNGIINVHWMAQSSVIINKSKAVSVGWGFSIYNDGSMSYKPPRILKFNSKFHNTGIKNLPEQ